MAFAWQLASWCYPHVFAGLGMSAYNEGLYTYSHVLPAMTSRQLTSVYFVIPRAATWPGRWEPWPTQSALPSIRRTASATSFTSPRWRPSPASTGLNSNVLAHVAASSGSLSSRPGLRFTSTRPPSGRTGPRAVCSCSGRKRLPWSRTWT